MSGALRIDVFADIVCPWCFIGSERLDRVLSAPALDTVVVHHHPFLLDPSTPEAGTNIPEMLRKKYGGDPATMFARVEGAARESGIELDLSKQAYSYPTVRAHTLLRHAAAKGTQHALLRALFRANFMDASNVSDPDVLAAIASEHGFEADEVQAIVRDDAELTITRLQTEEAHRLGITGVPFFVFGERVAVSGAQPEAVLRRAIESASA